MTAGKWDAILPEAGTNLVYNPAATITGNLTAIGAGTVSRVTTYHYYGPACHRIQASADNTGGYFTIKAAANAIHYVTMRINTASDVGTFDVSMDNSNWNDMALLSTEGDWKVYGVQIPAAQANGSTALRIQQKGAGAIDMYIGHVQVEQNTYPTTPIMGNLSGYYKDADGNDIGYAWEGTPHASASTRSAQERAGGRVVDIQDTYGVKVLWATGIGMVPATHHTMPQALLPGMRYTGFKVDPRVLDLQVVMGTNWAPETVHSVRKLITSALDLDGVATPQPVKLRYRDALSTKPVEYNAVYDTGLEFPQASNTFPEQTAVRLICYDPYAYELPEGAASLTTSQSSANANYIMRRLSGVWSSISSAFDGAIRKIVRAANGNVYICGRWNADVSTAADGYGIGVVEYNPQTNVLTSLGTGLGGNKDVFDMAVAANGDLYIVGDFLDAGGTAAADYCAYWDISASGWVAMSSGLGGAGNRVVIGQDGTVYIGGAFTNLTDANGDYITKWTGSAFVSMSTGLPYVVDSLAIAPDGTLYAMVLYSLGASTSKIYRWSGSAWVQVAECDDNTETFYGITFDTSGNLYACGNFQDIDSVAISYAAKYNGQQWSSIGTFSAQVLFLYWDAPAGLLHAAGSFTTVDQATATGYAIYNGYSWSGSSIDLPGTYAASALLTYGSSLYIGYQDAGTATESSQNTITNSGTARAYPVIHIKREGGTSATVRYFKNDTTNHTLWFNYALLDGEELTIDFRPTKRSITSSFFGKVWRAVLEGSEFSEFYLQKGTNLISAYVAQVGTPTMTQYMTWATTHTGADGAAA